MHDHCALLTLKFCKAITSTYDENSTYHENVAQKSKLKSFMKSVYEENRKKQKAPRETPPPLLSPYVNHPPHAEMKHTEEADALVPELAARWRAKREHLNKLYLTICKEEESSKKIIYSAKSQDHTPSRIHAKSFKRVRKFITIYINQQNVTPQQHELQQERPNDRKQLYEANHLYLMIANKTNNVQENQPPQNDTPSQDDLSY